MRKSQPTSTSSVGITVLWGEVLPDDGGNTPVSVLGGTHPHSQTIPAPKAVDPSSASAHLWAEQGWEGACRGRGLEVKPRRSKEKWCPEGTCTVGAPEGLWGSALTWEVVTPHPGVTAVPPGSEWAEAPQPFRDTNCSQEETALGPPTPALRFPSTEFQFCFGPSMGPMGKGKRNMLVRAWGWLARGR